MKLSVFQKIYSLPAPELQSREISVQPEKILLFPTPEELEKTRFAFSNVWAKFFFFLFREGPSLTYRKIAASLLQKKILRSRKVVLAIGAGREPDQYILAVGPQDCPHSEHLIFPVACSLLIAKSRDIERDYRILSGYFQANPDVFESLYHYSPHSGRELKFDLDRALSGQDVDLSGRNTIPPVTLQALAGSEGVQQRLLSSRRRYDSDLFMVGAGAYTSAYILPSMRDLNNHTLVDLNPALACLVGDKFNFLHTDTSCSRALQGLSECQNPVLVIASYHSSHLDIAEQALSYNPCTKVFIEKPPVTTFEQLQRLIEMRKRGHFIEIGYNRRYSKFAQQAKELFSKHDGPITMSCIVKELKIPKSHWYYWPTEGTRITGNLCHWIDLGYYFIQKTPISLTLASSVGLPPGDEISVIVAFEDGSRLTLMASDRGNSLRGVQEYIDIRRGDLTIVIDDFLKMKVQKGGTEKVRSVLLRDKGHAKMYRELMLSAHLGRSPLYSDDDLAVSSALYLTITDMALHGISYKPLGS